MSAMILSSNGEHGAVFLERHLDVVNLIATVPAIAHVLDPRLAPFDRPAELEREIGQQQLFLIGLNLNAEGTADVRRDHADLSFGKTQDIGDAPSERMRIRRRRPHGQAVFFFIISAPDKRAARSGMR